ncbi:PMEI domain-containing protein [Heracleum sosnowskyi]|uniref:PMEI domain-containing protein n=1 Tax=Heracleum sosnowskyi TaxID=360622 RepID=A0AAD8MBG2_9APIA|nr:PMEI domain-containing protein [Heracleum sosnowskyi]
MHQNISSASFHKLQRHNFLISIAKTKTRDMELHTFTTHICLKFIVTLLFICCILKPTPTSATKVPKTYQTFIRTSCNTTTYPSLCYKSLLPYASSIKTDYIELCSTALSVTVKAAKNTSALVTDLAQQKGLTHDEASAIKDCIENIEDTVDELQQTIKAMANLEGSDRKFQLSNARTWASAAITDEDTCMDGFSGRHVSSGVKNKVKKSILAVTKLNSNALSLINRIY